MSVIHHRPSIDPFPPTELAIWRSLSTAVISDELNRSHTMDCGIRPIGAVGEVVAGHALTVRAMVGDNLAIHHAVAAAEPGSILVIDAGGVGPTAVWGGILHRAAELRGVTAVIVDGCVRDSAEIVGSSMVCYARGTVPAGPQKSWGGEINSRVAAGGCVVTAGDLIVADSDGVVVVAAADRAAVRERCEARVKTEQAILERLEAGETTVEIFGL